MRITVFEPIHASAMAWLRERALVTDWQDPEADDLSLTEGVIVRTVRVTAEMMARAPRLRVIGSHGVGVDNIDLAEAARRGVRVVNVPSGTESSVAELYFALMLAVARQIIPGMDAIRAGRAERTATLQRGLQLAGSRLGIAGYGRIGRRVAEIGRLGFGMEVHAWSRSLDPGAPPEGVTVHRTLRSLCAAADFLCLCVPLTEETRGLVGAEELACCRPSAVLVNGARGGVVDEQALAAALREGRLFGAACDVFADEPPQPENPLFACPRFVGSQHIGVNTDQALAHLGMAVSRGVVDVLEGREPEHPVSFGPAR